MEKQLFEDSIFCVDCGKDITELRRWKNEKYAQSPFFCPLRYCPNCVSQAQQQGYIFIDGMKTSKTIEQLIDESIHMWE